MWEIALQKFDYWGPLVIILIGEHILLTYRYRKTSSLTRLTSMRTASSRTDGVYFTFYYVIIGHVAAFLHWFFLPGIAYVGLLYLHQTYQFGGLFSGLMPTNGVIAIIVWLLLLDLSIFCAHIAMHKVPGLWRFHRLHHAATEFNIVTGTRVSLAEKFLTDIFILGVLTIIFGIARPETLMWVLFVRKFVDIVQHSDLPWDYGPFGYVIASPRFHRMHHSRHTSDYDANYGDIFTIWDYLFRTVAPRYREDPALADSCELGLHDDAETQDVNRTIPAILRESVFHYVFLIGKVLARPFQKRP